MNLFFQHDHCHCNNQKCPKSKTCFRAFLAREDVRLAKEKPGTKMWCSYAGFKPDDKGECEDYVEMEEEEE